MIRPLFLLLAPLAIALAGCDDQLAKNLTGQSGVDRVPPASTAFYAAPVETVIPVSETVAVEPTVEPEPIVEIIAPPPPPACVPQFRQPCPGDE